jgi:hypothetical protein
MSGEHTWRRFARKRPTGCRAAPRNRRDRRNDRDPAQIPDRFMRRLGVKQAV